MNANSDPLEMRLRDKARYMRAFPTATTHHDAVPLLLEEAADAIIDLSCDALQTLPDDRIVMLLGGPEKADEAASRARYVMNVAIREADVLNSIRDYARERQAMLDALAHLDETDPVFCRAQGEVEAANKAYMLAAKLDPSVSTQTSGNGAPEDV